MSSFSTTLDRNGWVALGQGDKARCYSCHVVHEGWKVGDSPEKYHRPNCRYVYILLLCVRATGVWGIQLLVLHQRWLHVFCFVWKLHGISIFVIDSCKVSPAMSLFFESLWVNVPPPGLSTLTISREFPPLRVWDRLEVSLRGSLGERAGPSLRRHSPIPIPLRGPLTPHSKPRRRAQQQHSVEITETLRGHR